MKRIVIDIFGEEDGHLRGMTEINSDELCLIYADIGSLHGLQSSYDGDDERHIEQMKICSQIVNLAKKLEEIS